MNATETPPVSRTELDDLARLSVQLMLQVDETDRVVRRLRLWVLCLTLLLLSITIIVCALWRGVQ